MRTETQDEATRRLSNGRPPPAIDAAVLRTALELVPAFMVVVRGPNHVIEYANQAFRRLVGERPLDGLELGHAVPEMAGQGHIDFLNDAYVHGTTCSGSELLIRLQRAPHAPAENRRITFEYLPMCEPDGAIHRVLVHGFDVTGQPPLELPDVIAGESAQRTCDERLRRIVAHSGQLVWLAEREPRRFLFLTDGCESLWQLTRAALYANPALLDERIALDQRARVVDARRRVRDGGIYEVEYLINRPDGSQRRIRERGFPVGSTQVGGTAEDITERSGPPEPPAASRSAAPAVAATDADPGEAAERHAAHLLRQSEARFRLMVEGSEQVFFYSHDDAGRFEYLSPSVDRVLGYRAADLVGAHYSVLLAPGLQGDVHRHTDEALRTGRAAPAYSAVTRHRDGRTVYLEITERPVPGAAGVLAMHGFARDVTERVLAEQQLAELHSRLWGVLNTSPLPIVVVDHGRTVQLWNRAAEEMFGWTALEIVGRPYPLLDPDESGAPDRIFEAAYRGETVRGTPVRRRTRSGKELDLSVWNAQLPDTTGKAGSLIGIFADVSEQRQLQDLLRQAQKMEAVGRLAGGVAHDFNNLLTAIEGHAQLALEVLSPGEPLHEEISEIMRSTERAAALTRQLLAFSRQQVLAPRVLHVGTVVTGLRMLLARLITENIELVTNAADDLWLVRADPGQVEQVLINLAVNARDALPDGGRIEITVENAVLNGSQPRRCPHAAAGEYVRITVADNGVGIAPDHLPFIFEPFFTTKEHGKGTGLGLATVYGIVKQSGGFIELDPGRTRGTAFTIFLPRVLDLEEPAPEAPTCGLPKRGSETILLVEDEPAVRALAQRVLERAGYHVITAENGDEALLKAERYEGVIDLLVSDVVMPRLSGYHVAAALRRARPALTVILMSGYSEEEVNRTSGAHGADCYIGKPFSPRDLVSAVRDTLDRCPGADPSAAHA